MKKSKVFFALFLAMCILTSTVFASSANFEINSASKGEKLVSVGVEISDLTNLKDIFVVALNYKEGVLKGASYKKIDSSNAVSLKEEIKVESEADETKVFLYSEGNLIKSHSIKNYSAEKPSDEKPTLFLIGDSICVEYKAENQYPQQGWGVKLTELLDGVNVVNCSAGGYSTATFMVYDRYAKAYGNKYAWNSDKVITDANGTVKNATPILPQIKAGDFVIVSLGTNDGWSIDRTVDELGQTTAATYKKHLKQFIDDTRAKGAEIILVTPTTNGKYKTGTTEYVENYSGRASLMMEVAKENNAICLPLGAKMAEKYNTMTEDEVKKNHMIFELVKDQIKVDFSKHNNSYVKQQKDDTTHLSDHGAAFVANLIAEMLKETNSGLTAYLK